MASTDLTTTTPTPGTDLEVVEPDEILDDDAATDAHTTRLFDRDAYANPKLIVETEDGTRVDELVVKIAGSITLQRDSEAACEMYRALKQGRAVSLHLLGSVVGDGHDLKARGDDELVVGTRKIRTFRINNATVAGQEHVI